MNIWKRIILGFIAVIAVMIIVETNALLNNIEIINRVDDLENSKRIELTQSNKLAYGLQRIKSNIRELFMEIQHQERPDEINYATEQVNLFLPELDSALEAMYKATELGYSRSEDEGDKERELEELLLLDSLNVMTTEFTSEVETTIDLVKKGEIKEAEEHFENILEPLSRQIQNVISDIVSDAEEEVSWAMNNLNLKVDKAIKLGIYLTILSIFLSLAIGLYISRSISKPLHKLILGTKEIENGNLEYNVTIDSKGELQLLANSFNNMVNELRTRIEAINKLNLELEESNQTKDKYFSIIAHDLKNPFNVILGFTDLLVDHYHEFDEEKRRQIIGELHKSSKVIYDLLENLLNWSRSQSGKIDLYPKDLNLYTIIENSIISHKSNADNKQIFIINKIPENISVFADEFTMNVVINNILNNAIKFTPKGGQVTISTAQNGNNTELSIKDTGIGMKQETINKLFLSKNITSTPGTENEQGTGLGLVIIKDFIEKNNGTLTIKSEPKKGTEFLINLTESGI